MYYGKFKYDQAIKAKQARKKQSKVEIKEMKFRPKIDVGDYNTKKKHVLRFLEQGCKVKITIMFRGREMAHPEIGLSILERLADHPAADCHKQQADDPRRAGHEFRCHAADECTQPQEQRLDAGELPKD